MHFDTDSLKSNISNDDNFFQYIKNLDGAQFSTLDNYSG